jgi:hypothetical protein
MSVHSHFKIVLVIMISVLSRINGKDCGDQVSLSISSDATTPERALIEVSEVILIR